MKTGFIVILSFIFYSCCRPGAQIREQSNPNIDAEILEVYSWLNLMPGTSDPSIHLTAKIRINNKDDSVKDISVKQIEIVTDSASVVLSDIDMSSSETGILEKGKSREFTVKAGKELNKRYSFDKPSIIYFYFISDDNIYKFEAVNITIEKVY